MKINHQGHVVPKVIAHRGGRRWAPENTMAAFRKSIDLGVYGIELDVHRLRSGELAVIHDDDVRRTTSGAGFVKDLSYKEVRQLSAGLWFSQEFAEERIPLLEEVLELVAGRVVINVEVKNAPIEYRNIEDDLIRLLRQYPYPDSIIISSFDHQVLARLKRKAPDLTLAILAEAIFENVGFYAKRIGATLWHPSFDCLRADAVREAHMARLKVNAWTLNSREQWSHGLEMGLDGIVTDDPEGLMAFLSGCGAIKS